MNDMWGRLLDIVGRVMSDTQGNLWGCFSGICTQTLIFNLQPEEISLQLFTWINKC